MKILFTKYSDTFMQKIYKNICILRKMQYLQSKVVIVLYLQNVSNFTDFFQCLRLHEIINTKSYEPRIIL